MSRLILLPALLALSGGSKLATTYAPEKPVRVEVVTKITLETTSREMIVDGEPREPRGGDQASAETRTIAFIDTVLEAEDGRPTRVRRAFEEMTAETSMTFGDESRDDEREGSLHEVTLELSLDEDGEVEVEVVDGSEPDNEEALAGHRLTFALDAFLEDGDAEVGATWDLESDAILHALGLDSTQAMFPRPERDESERGEGRGRRFGGGRGGSGSQFLAQAEWEGEAELAEEGVDFEGQSCVVIELKLETSGELEEPEFGGRRDFMASEAAAPFESTYSAELEGKLYFSTKLARPVGLRLEGSISTERNTEREFNGRSMSMSSTREGTYKYNVTITEAESDQ